MIFIRLGGPDPAKQQLEVLAHCDRHNYEIDSVCRRVEDAAAVVAAGQANMVVAAYGRADDELARVVAGVGGQVEYVRPLGRRRLEWLPLIGRLYRSGKTVPEIAKLLDESTGDIRRWLG